MKLKLHSLIILLLVTTVSVNAQRVELMLVPFEEDGKWGYLNVNDSIVVEPIFEEAYPTYGLRGRIKAKSKYGFIDEKGEIVIKPKYDAAENFQHGIAAVGKNGKTIFIRPDGKVNTRPLALCGGIFRQCLSPRDFYGIDTIKSGNQIQVQFNRMVREDGKFNYVLDTLKTIFDEVTSIGRQHIIIEQDERKSFFFDQIGYPSAEYIDTTLNFQYENFKFFSCQGSEIDKHEIFGFKKGGKWGYIELFYQPKEIIEAKYLSINSIETGFALVEYEQGKYGYVHQSGKEYFRREKE